MWNRTCSFKDQINEVGLLRYPNCRKLVCWLTREAEKWGRALPGMEGLKTGLSSQVDDH